MEGRPSTEVLYLHIGMHKTGTTALQKFFALNEEVLAAHGICYPKEGRAKTPLAHHDIANSLKGPPFPIRQPDKSVDEYRSGIRDCFDYFPGVLLSSEIFMRFVPAFRDHLDLDLSNLAPLISAADQVKVIIYLRRQDDYLESFYSQEIEHDLHTNFPDFVSNRMPDYFEICQNLADYFGKTNVIVKIYDKRQFTGGNIFSDFLAIFGIELTGEFTLPEEGINPSFMPDEREFKKLVNALDLRIDEVRRFTRPLMMLSAMKRLPGGDREPDSSLFSHSERSDLLQACSISNGRVATEFMDGVGADETLFPDNTGSALPQKKVYAGLSNKALDDIIGYLKGASPDLITLLSTAVAQGLKSENIATRNSAGILKAVFQ